MHAVYGRTVCGARWSPVVQRSRTGQTMGESMGDAEATAALQLGEHDNHLSVCIKMKTNQLETV